MDIVNNHIYFKIVGTCKNKTIALYIDHIPVGKPSNNTLP